MARKKITLAWISNDAARRATLKKRRKGLMKKVKELSILCDVRACAVIYSPEEQQPDVWPSASDAARMLSHFRSMPETEQSKKMVNQESFLRQRVAKLHDQLQRHQREIRELESSALLRECVAGGGGGSKLSGLRMEELTALAWALDNKIKAVQNRIERLRSGDGLQAPWLGDAAAAAAVLTGELHSGGWDNSFSRSSLVFSRRLSTDQKPLGT